MPYLLIYFISIVCVSLLSHKSLTKITFTVQIMVLVPCIAAFFKLLECLILAMYELTMKDSNFPTVYIKQLSNCAKVFQYCNLWTKSPCSVDSSRHQVTAHQCIHLNLITYLWSLPCFRSKAYSLDVTELIFSFPTQSRFLLQSSAHFALLANSFISGFLFFFFDQLHHFKLRTNFCSSKW